MVTCAPLSLSFSRKYYQISFSGLFVFAQNQDSIAQDCQPDNCRYTMRLAKTQNMPWPTYGPHLTVSGFSQNFPETD